MLWSIEGVEWIILWEFYKWMCACINPIVGQGAEVDHGRIKEYGDPSLCVAWLIEENRLHRCVSKILTSHPDKDQTLGNDLRRISMVIVKFHNFPPAIPFLQLFTTIDFMRIYSWPWIWDQMQISSYICRSFIFFTPSSYEIWSWPLILF